MFVEHQDAICARLRARIPDVHIEGDQVTIDLVPQFRRYSPAIFVIYEGFGLIEEKEGSLGRVVNVGHNFLIVCAAQDAAKGGNEAPARRKAGLLALAALHALLGFEVYPGTGMRLNDSPGPEFDGGYCYVPLAFTVRETVRASRE